MKPEVRIPALGMLGRVPIPIFAGFINSAFKGSELDRAYVDKYINAYTAYLYEDAYATVINTLKPEPELAKKAGTLYTELKSAGYEKSEYDLASILQSGEMAFKSSETDVLPDDDGEDAPTLELDADDKYVLSGHCTAVVNAYKLLYANVCSTKPPLGAYGLCPGHAKYTKGAIYSYSDDAGRDAYRTPDVGGMLSIRALYKALGFDSLTESSKWSALELGAKDSHIYSVRYMGRFTNKVVEPKRGKEASSSDYWKHLGDWVESKLLSVYEAYIDKGMDEAWLAVSRASKNLATAFIIEECDIRVSNLLLVKVCAPSLEIKAGEDAMAVLEKRMLASGQQNLAVRAIEPSSNSTGFTVYTIAVALNDVLEADAPSFAYQAWDDALSTGKSLSEVLGTHNVIFGRHADGTQRNFDLADQNGKAHNMAVIAGAGSGKGLTTLATLGAAAARKEPVFYLDCKPEMSSILRSFMAERGQAGRVYSYDGQAVQLQLNNLIQGSSPDKYRPFEMPYGIMLSDAAKNGLAISKAIALLLALMKYLSVEAPEDQKARWESVGYSGVGGLAVFDELQLMNSLAWIPMTEAVMKLPKTRDKDPNYAEYVEKLKNFVNASEENIRGAANALLRYSPISTLSLFQDFKFVTNEKPVFQGLFRLQNLVGRLGDSGNDNTRRVANPRLYDVLDKRKWAVAPTSANQVNLATLSNPIKPYLVFGTPSDVKGYQKSPAWNALPEDYRATLDESKLDFIGLLTHPDYNIDLAGSLACGYDIAQHMLNMAGFGGTVEDYITSFQPEAMLDYTTLYKTAFKNFAAIKAGEIQYTNPPLAGTGPTPAPFAVGGNAAEGDYANSSDTESPVDILEYDDLEDDILGMGTPVNVLEYDGTEDDILGASDDEAEDANFIGGSEIQTPMEQGTVKDADGVDSAITPKDVEQLRRAVAEGQPLLDTFVQKGTVTGMKEFLSKYWDLDEYLSKVKPFEILPEHKELVSDFHRLYAFCSDKYRRSVELDQPQEQPKQQLFHINGMAFVLGDDGNFHYHSGRLAPLHNVPPGTFQGEARATAPSIDQNSGQMPFNDVNGERVISDPNSLQYAQMIDEPEVKFKGKVKPIAHDMPQAKFEKAMSQRWRILLTAASKSVGGAGLVATLGISESALFVNGVRFHPPAGLLDEAGLKVTDIIDYDMTFRTFKQLKQLDLDYPAYASFSASYSNPAVPFTKHKTLQAIVFTHSDGRRVPYTRANASERLNLPVDKLHSNFNTWTAMSAQVNKGSTSSFCKPGTRLIMADYTKRLAVGAFGPNSSWSTRRKALGFIGMLFTGAATVVTGGVQAARASVRQK